MVHLIELECIKPPDYSVPCACHRSQARMSSIKLLQTPPKIHHVTHARAHQHGAHTGFEPLLRAAYVVTLIGKQLVELVCVADRKTRRFRRK